MQRTSKKPLISVVIPTYNCAHYLKDAIQSVINQTINDYEIIVINNFSNDNTIETVNRFQNPNIKLINFKNHGEISKSRNKGIELSQGKFIAFLDADDIWNEKKLELQLPLFDNPDVGLVYSNIQNIEPDKRKLGSPCPISCHRGNVFEKLLVQSFITCSTVIVRSDVFIDKSLWFKTGRPGTEDWDLWLRVTRKTEVDFVNLPLVDYRVYAESVSKKTDLMYKSCQVTLLDVEKEIKRSYPPEKIESLLAICEKTRFIYELRYAHWLLARNAFCEAKVHFLNAFSKEKFNFRSWWGFLKYYLFFIKKNSLTKGLT